MKAQSSVIAVNILLFARYREVAGSRSITLQMPYPTTVGDLARQMLKNYPTLVHDAANLVVAVNEEYRDHDFALQDGDEVALIPPVSGGQSNVLVTDRPLEPQNITQLVKASEHGAVVTFLGNTRNENDGRAVMYLEYEAYRPMADQKIAEVIKEMKAKWPIGAVAIAHRIGRVNIGEESLVVAVGAGHRHEAFEAALFAVDRIKEIVPIWKKEFFEGGEIWIGSQDGRGFFDKDVSV